MGVTRSCVICFAIALGGIATALPGYAGFTVTSTRTSAGAVDVVVFSVTNTGGNTGTKINGWDMTLSTSLGFLTFDQRDINGDGAPDVNLPGYELTFGDSAGTSARLFNAGMWDGLTLSGSRATLPYRSDINAGGVQDFDPESNYAHVSLARFVGVTMGPGENDTSPLPFLNAVVPAGAAVTLTGQLGGNSGLAVRFTAVNLAPAEAAPEPGTLGVLGLGALALVRRSRR